MPWSFKELFWQSAELPRRAEADPTVTARGVNGAARRTEAALAVLRDVRGVVGSIAVNLEGQVLAMDLPQTFDEPTAHRLGTRISLLREVAVLERGQCDGCLLVCSSFQLHVHGMSWGTLGILVEPDAVPPALDVVLKVIAARTLGAPLAPSDTRLGAK